jgi:hypothetical protein
MALADGVFCNVATFEDIQTHTVPSNKDFRTVRYNINAKDRPILRAQCPDGSISEDRMLTYEALNNALKGLGQRAAYEDDLTGYCFRRAYARSIISTW